MTLRTSFFIALTSISFALQGNCQDGPDDNANKNPKQVTEYQKIEGNTVYAIIDESGARKTLQVSIEKKNSNDPSVKYSDLGVKAFDSQGSEIALSQSPNMGKSLVEIEMGGRKTAFVVYDLNEKPNQKVASIEISWRGKKLTFTPKRTK